MEESYVPDEIPWLSEHPVNAVTRPSTRRARRKVALTAIDHHLGSRLRLCRTTQGLSLQQLGDRVGITYQQAHKYERGQSRIPAGLLHALATSLGVETAWFYEGFGDSNGPAGLNHYQRLCLDISRNFAVIGNDKVVEAFAHMVRTLAMEANANHKPD